MSDAAAGVLPGGRLVCVADVADPAVCDAVEEIAHHAQIQHVFFRRYGYWPKRVLKRLFWILALEPGHPALAYLPNQGGAFHNDAGTLSDLYAYFYLTEVTRSTGAHSVIVGSHRHKTMDKLLGSRYQTDAAIFEDYGEHREIMLEGPPGFGFLEDPTCFHKFHTPVRQARLTLQLRYS